MSPRGPEPSRARRAAVPTRVLTFVVASILVAAAASSARATTPLPSQPPEERARQALMPKSSDPIWSILARSKVTADVAHGVYRIDNPPEVKALAGHEMTVTGFVLPLDPSPRFFHFLLTRNTPVCPFCPPGAPNEAIEVNARTLMQPTTEPVTVTGRFVLQDNGAAGLFYQLDAADVTGGRRGKGF